MKAPIKPLGLTEEHLTFLDDLRDSGATNMWGARPYVEEEFPDLKPSAAGLIVAYWMDTYSERHLPRKE